MAQTIGEVTYNAYKVEFLQRGLGSYRAVTGELLVIKEWNELLPTQQLAFEQVGLAAAEFAVGARSDAQKMIASGNRDGAFAALARMGLSRVAL